MDLLSPDPVVIRRQRWQFPTNAGLVEWFNNNSQWLATDETMWEYTAISGVKKYRAAELDQKTLRVTCQVSGWVRYVIYFALLIAIPALLSPSWLYIILFLYLGIYGLNDQLPLAESPGRQITEHVHPAIAAIYFAGVITTGLWASSLFPPLQAQLSVIGFAGFYAITRLYSHNALPLQSNRTPGTIVRVPLNALREVVLPFGTIFLFGITNAWIVQVVETVIESLKQPRTRRGMASVLSELTGGAIGEVPPIEFFTQLERWVPILTVVICLYVIVEWTRESFRSNAALKTKLTKFTPTATQHKLSKSIRYILMLFWGGLTLGLIVFALGLVVYPLITQWVLPTAFVQPFSPLLPSGTPATPSGILDCILGPFYALARLIPGLHDGPIVGVLLAIHLLPVGYLVARTPSMISNHN